MRYFLAAFFGALTLAGQTLLVGVELASCALMFRFAFFGD